MMVIDDMKDVRVYDKDTGTILLRFPMGELLRQDKPPTNRTPRVYECTFFYAWSRNIEGIITATQRFRAYNEEEARKKMYDYIVSDTMPVILKRDELLDCIDVKEI